MGKRTELGMPIRPSKTRYWDKYGENVPNWECPFVHRKQGTWDQDGKRTELGMLVHRQQNLETRMGKRTELGMLIRPSKAKP